MQRTYSAPNINNQRGLAMKRKRSIEEGHVVESFTIGNTKIKICDDYCVKTSEEVQAILDRIGKLVFEQICTDTIKLNSASGN